MKIVEQGRVDVNHLTEFYRSDKVILLEIDLRTKNANIFSTCTGNGQIEIWYEETEDSTHNNQEKEEGSMTHILLDEYSDWILYNINHSRYTTYITLISKMED